VRIGHQTSLSSRGELGISHAFNSESNTRLLLSERFRCPDELIADFFVKGDLSGEPGFFQLGSDVVCYGKCSSGDSSPRVTDALYDAQDDTSVADAAVHLPFDAAEVVKNLRFERYTGGSASGAKTVVGDDMIRRLYYVVRPLLPVALRKHIQRLYFHGWETVPFPLWPVDFSVDKLIERLMILSMKSQGLKRIPFVWFWPDGAYACAIITHDVETLRGVDFSPQLMDLDDSFGIKAAFQVVPEERYPVSEAYLQAIRDRGFEVNVQDLNHDGLLFSHPEVFMERVKRINNYGKKFRAEGFRAAVLYRNADWHDALEFSYDMSIPNVAHLDPQRGGCCTVLPFFVGKVVELPVTATQDYTLFHIFNDYTIRLWKEQISQILQEYGLMNFIIHPDYVIDQPERQVFSELLQYLAQLRSEGELSISLPKDVAEWWRLRSQMTLVKEGLAWRIEGKGRERARVAYAILNDDTLSYELPKN
jgi:hypothetical protein